MDDQNKSRWHVWLTETQLTALYIEVRKIYGLGVEEQVLSNWFSGAATRRLIKF